MCASTGVLWGLLAYKTWSISLLQLLLKYVPHSGSFSRMSGVLGCLAYAALVKAMHISCGTLVGLLGSSLSDGAHGNNTGHRTFLPMPKRGGKYKWALQGRAEKIIKVPEYVSLHMTGFPETPTVPDAQTSYSSSAIYVIACALFAPGKSRVT